METCNCTTPWVAVGFGRVRRHHAAIWKAPLAVRTLWIGLAGFVGAVSRYHVEGFVSRRSAGAFPWGTFVVNLSGCFLLGLLATLFTERYMPDPRLRSAVTIGFLGAYTTFSTFAFETWRLAEDGAGGLAVWNVVASVLLGVAAAWLGVVIGRAV
jgi:CrcB protein